MAVADEIEKLKRQHAEGTLTDAEFAAAKAKLLAARDESGGRGVSRALWALVIVVLVAAAAAVFLLGEAGQQLKIIAGAAALCAGLLGSVLAGLEDIGILAIGALALGAVAIALVAFAVVAPWVLLVALPVLAIGALWAWMGDVIGG